jgi:hypothetical protein
LGVPSCAAGSPASPRRGSRTRTRGTSRQRHRATCVFPHQLCLFIAVDMVWGRSGDVRVSSECSFVKAFFFKNLSPQYSGPTAIPEDELLRLHHLLLRDLFHARLQVNPRDRPVAVCIAEGAGGPGWGRTIRCVLFFFFFFFFFFFLFSRANHATLRWAPKPAPLCNCIFIS